MRLFIQKGFVLTELLIAGLLTTFLMLGIIQMAAGTSRGLLLIDSLSQTQQGGRFAIDQIRDSVMSGGYHPAPWETEDLMLSLGDATADGGVGGNDTLEVQQFSDRNCYGNANDALDGNGRPEFFLRQSRFEVSASRNLAHTCWYGPEGGVMIRQINRLGLVQHVESFQVLYAEDDDEDRLPTRMVRAEGWIDAKNVVGFQVGLLVATEKPLGDGVSESFTVLDESITPPADGRLRKVWTSTIPLVSRLR